MFYVRRKWLTSELNGLRGDQKENQSEHPGMSPAFASDEKYEPSSMHTRILTRTHLTSAWNVVGAGALKRMENGVREGKRREKGVWGISGRIMIGRGRSRDRERSDGHGVYSPGDDLQKSGDLE